MDNKRKSNSAKCKYPKLSSISEAHKAWSRDFSSERLNRQTMIVLYIKIEL